MANFEEALKITLLNEGGSTNTNYTNRSDDGETYCGICRKYHPDWKGWGIIDLDKRSKSFPKRLDTIEPLQNLVSSFYRSEFWDKLRCDEINNQQIANKLFDIAVNIGASTAAKLIQIAVNALRESMGMPLIWGDGIIGDSTIKAINLCNSDMLLMEFKKKIINYYLKKNNPKYQKGWIKRAES